ncbi:MAG TPA: malto-oligosyltrehalose synthase [Acidimicrobiales bacterium]
MTGAGWSTYRVQLHARFGFREAAAVADYLAELGVSHLYCSPYLQAAPDSMHGYDVVDPERLSEDLGGSPGHAALVAALRAAHLGQILDIVPNHMALDPSNRWWWDVLENGPGSRYAPVFDIDWGASSERRAGTVLVPVLGDPYDRVLEAHQLAVRRRGGRFVVRYLDEEWPVSPGTLDGLLTAAGRRSGDPGLTALAAAWAELAPAGGDDGAGAADRRERTAELARRMELLCEREPSIAAAVDAEVAALNADVERLDALLGRQHYRLAHWRTANEELDYRRFFDIVSLIGVRVEDEAVFEATHRVVVDLVRRGTVDGLRVDHVDGLRDPYEYLLRLSGATGGAYTVVEKILAPGESLPGAWPVAGTSGYDFLNRVNNLFVASGNEAAMTDCYQALTGETATYEQVAYDARRQVMREELVPEVERLTGLLALACRRHRPQRDHTRSELREVLVELVARLPVYRTYARPGAAPSPEDRRHVDVALETLGAQRPDIDPELARLVGDLALGLHEGEVEMELAQRLAQLSAPVMAKGVEDTAFYRYHRLVSLNEVGGDPGQFGRPVTAFHSDTAATAERWPTSMLTLSTHDTKRSADVRARLNVLSEIPGPWAQAADRWTAMTERYRRDRWPDPNAVYLLLQTLVGAWPIDADRLAAFMAKAAREAKVHTSWVDPVADYEDALEAFVRSIVGDPSFVDDVRRFLTEHRVVERGRRNSLAQCTLLVTAPGNPDLYQGCELWDSSLVDPDNRRPVDYDRRRRLLGDLPRTGGELVDRDDAGRVKLWLLHRLLQHRRHHSSLYTSVDYEALRVTGRRADDAVGFCRGGLAVVVPRLGPGDWSATEVTLPPGRWTDGLSGAVIDGGRRPLGEVFGGFPVAVLARERA